MSSILSVVGVISLIVFAATTFWAQRNAKPKYRLLVWLLPTLWIFNQEWMDEPVQEMRAVALVSFTVCVVCFAFVGIME